METKYRIIVLCVLLVGAVGLCVQYERADLWTYPDGEEIATDPGAHDGQRTLLFGRVQSVDAASNELTFTVGDDPPLELTIQQVSPSVIDSVGVDRNLVQVYGVLGEESTVLVAENIVVDHNDSTDSQYVYLTSILGGLLAAGYFLWHWGIDGRRLGFQPRSDR